MIPETQIEERHDSKKRNQELIGSLLGTGVLVALLYGALAVLRRRKATVLRPLIALALLGIAFALVIKLLKALRSRASDNA